MSGTDHQHQYTPRHETLHLADMQRRPAFLTRWERTRHRGAHWFVECFAEFLGVFLYCYAGIGSTAAWILGGFVGEELGSLFTVGFAYAIGIVLALVICSATSGGHLHPAITIVMTLFKGFPPLKAVRYIIAQILGAYVACLIIYLQWKHIIVTVEDALIASGTFDTVMFQPTGPAGIFALYATTGSSLGLILINEFVVDFVIGLTIFACLDPTNFFCPPAAAPWVIAFVYAIAVWGYSPVGLAANPARDIGARLMAITIWGLKASGGRYAAIAGLTSIPATVCSFLCYEFMFVDSSRVVPGPNRAWLEGHKAHLEHVENTHMYPNGTSTVTSHAGLPTIGHASSPDLEGKAHESRSEVTGHSKA
ncbi:aquaporin-like protein [Stereum hirsutum FP-91666 SS1]|uniref:aquaporin-like protein n=1 Tax=Stereum hirsutum (strain FP-91666) TaxID=721885 RepID=UPI000440DBA3|nr:aquaporin-like protein [Stereum hirsutum FP-91666 SS1]EIM91284.1 aquaporin-like protein [Stereum hirsutum FP-91666 SS1]